LTGCQDNNYSKFIIDSIKQLVESCLFYYKKFMDTERELPMCHFLDQRRFSGFLLTVIFVYVKAILQNMKLK